MQFLKISAFYILWPSKYIYNLRNVVFSYSEGLVCENLKSELGENGNFTSCFFLSSILVFPKVQVISGLGIVG